MRARGWWLRFCAQWWAALACTSTAYSQTATPLSGHYPPGQSGIRGAATPGPGVSYTNFSRLFTNRDVLDAAGDRIAVRNELRYANISMITWTSGYELFGMTPGAMVGIPFATGDLRRAESEEGSARLGLSDALVTLALYGASAALDYQLQLTVWTASGRFTPGSASNRGTGFWALVYSLGGVYYPKGDRDAWSLSAVARIEQNFEQKDSGVEPGDDVVVDWGLGRLVPAGGHPVDVGVSGFVTWQLTSQMGEGEPPPGRYRFFGAGPEVSVSLTEALACRVRVHREFGGRSVVQGDNLWVILNYKW